MGEAVAGLAVADMNTLKPCGGCEAHIRGSQSPLERLHRALLTTELGTTATGDDLSDGGREQCVSDTRPEARGDRKLVGTHGARTNGTRGDMATGGRERERERERE